jgi:hypothetical protein
VIPPLVRIPLVVLLAAAGWAVWDQGGVVLEWAGLDELDTVGRLVLVFAFLTACEAILTRLLPRLQSTHPENR